MVVDTYNCGDSRAYVLETAPRGGLAALTVDDTRCGDDALAGLLQDEPLQRFMNADEMQTLTFRNQVVRSPCVVFVASDGFHHYCRTPLGVEVLLRSAMRAAVAESEPLLSFGQYLERHFREHLHDDVSAAFQFVGGSPLEVMTMLTAPKAECRRFAALVAEEQKAAEGPDAARGAWLQRRADYERYVGAGR